MREARARAPGAREAHAWGGAPRGRERQGTAPWLGSSRLLAGEEKNWYSLSEFFFGTQSTKIFSA